MANPFQRGNSWTFYYYVRDDYGKRKQVWKGGYATKKEAETELRRYKAMTELGQITYNSQNTIRVSAYLQEWLDLRKTSLQPHTIDNYAQTINKHIIPGIGNLRLQDLSPKVLQRFYNDLSTQSNLSAKTIQFVNSVLKAALRGAIEEGYVKTNVFSGVKLPRIKKFKPQLLSIEQIQTLFQALPGHQYETEIKLATLLGLRRGEVLGIQEQDIDFKRHTLSIERQVSVIKDSSSTKQGDLFGLKCLKSESSNRTLYLSEDIERLLKDKICQNRVNKQSCSSYIDLGLVCCKANGEIINPQSLTNSFQRLLTKCGLPRLRFHDLRHTYATLCIDMKVPIKTLSQALGHSSTAITDLVYADSIKANRELADIISKAIFAEDSQEYDK